LLSSFMVWPLPVGPVWITRPAKASSTGLARATSVSAPGHDVERSLHRILGGAGQGGVDQGDALGREFAREPRGDGGVGGRASMTISGLPAASRPPGPPNTASTCGEPVTQSTTMSLRAASARGVARAERQQRLDSGPVAMGHHGQRPALLRQVAGHTGAHQAQADESDLFLHRDAPLPTRRPPGRS